MNRKNKIFILILLFVSVIFVRNVNAKVLTQTEYEKLKIERAYIVGSYIFDMSKINPTVWDLTSATATSAVYKSSTDPFMVEIVVAKNLNGNIERRYINLKTQKKLSTFPNIDVMYVYRSHIMAQTPNKEDKDILDEKKYTVTFNPNGGSVSTKTKSVTYNEKYGTLPTPTRSGYTFTGWYTSKSGGTRVQASDTVNITSNQTLYAHWGTITYYLDLNGSLDGVSKSNLSNYATVDIYVNGKLVKDDAQDYYAQHEYGATYEIKDIKAKTGYICSGVTSDSSALKGTITKVTNIKLNCTTKKVKVTFKRNYSILDVTKSSQTFTYGVSGQKFSDKGWTRSNYNLAGWSETQNGSVIYKTLSDVFDSWINEKSPEITLYAVWQSKKTYTATFNKNGASLIGQTSLSCTATSGTSCTVIAPSITASSGFSVVGWGSSSSSTTSSVVPGKIITLSSNKTYYAVTKSTLTATFEKNGASSIGTSKLTCDRYNGASSCTVKTPTITAISGFKSLGWAESSSSTSVVVGVSSNLKLTSSKTLYALTRSNNYYTVTFWPESGSFGTNPKGVGIIQYSYRYNGSNYATGVAPKITLSNPSKQKFSGWSIVKNSTTVSLKDQGTYFVNANTEFFAVINQVVTVTFANNQADRLSKYSATCVNYGSGCMLNYKDIPFIYAKGKDTYGFSYSSRGEGIFYILKQNFKEDTTMYAIAGSFPEMVGKSISIASENNVHYMPVYLENSYGLQLTTFNRYISELNKIYNNAPFLFDSRAKINFVTQSTLNYRHNSSGYVGMTYGWEEYPNIDVKMTSNYSEETTAVIIHELSHAFDKLYGVIKGKKISDQQDLIALYNKYKNVSNRPLRDYAYTNAQEFWAESFERYYYIKLLKTSYPLYGYITEDICSLVEKYVNIAKNGY